MGGKNKKGKKGNRQARGRIQEESYQSLMKRIPLELMEMIFRFAVEDSCNETKEIHRLSCVSKKFKSTLKELSDVFPSKIPTECYCYTETQKEKGKMCDFCDWKISQCEKEMNTMNNKKIYEQKTRNTHFIIWDKEVPIEFNVLCDSCMYFYKYHYYDYYHYSEYEDSENIFYSSCMCCDYNFDNIERDLIMGLDNYESFLDRTTVPIRKCVRK